MDIFFLILVHLYFHHCFFGLNNIVWIPRVNEYKVVHCSTIREDHWSITCTMNSVHIPSQSNPNGFCAFLNDKMSSGQKSWTWSGFFFHLQISFQTFCRWSKNFFSFCLPSWLALLSIFLVTMFFSGLHIQYHHHHHYDWCQSVTKISLFTMEITNRPRVGDPPPLRKYKVPNEKLKQLHRWGMKSSLSSSP